MEEVGGLPDDGRETAEETWLRERLAERKQKLKLNREHLETAQRDVIKLRAEKETKVISQPAFKLLNCHPAFNVTFS
jgi:hypothetical protein